ncbi:retrovirus-related pol polyprotein from transposon TNT 1-94 [Tanacetum coccineum]
MTTPDIPVPATSELLAKVGIRQTKLNLLRTPEQNGVVERQNRTLVEAARTMLSATKVPLFFWAKAIATSCFTQNRSLVIPRHEKTPYHIINAWKPSVKFFHILLVPLATTLTRDGENLDKMKEKVKRIFVPKSTPLTWVSVSRRTKPIQTNCLFKIRPRGLSLDSLRSTSVAIQFLRREKFIPAGSYPKSRTALPNVFTSAEAKYCLYLRVAHKFYG